VLDLNLLMTFEAIERARSVSGAARALGLSQPATSASLARLRRALGDELFTFAGGAMQPTAVARRLAPSVHAALGELRTALDVARPFEPAAAETSFTLGVTDYASAVVVPGLIAGLAASAPRVGLRLVSYRKEEIGPLVEAGALDLAIGVFPDPPERCILTRLMTERFVGVARQGHAALARPLEAASFAAFSHALFTTQADARGAVDEALAALGLQRRVTLTLPYLMALPEALKASDLVAAVPARAAARFGPGLGTFDLPVDLPSWSLQMLWSPFSRRDSAQTWLRAQVTDVCTRL
jgi:DNA-binding transcriptional LysR family regulator